MRDLDGLVEDGARDFKGVSSSSTSSSRSLLVTSAETRESSDLRECGFSTTFEALSWDVGGFNTVGFDTDGFGRVGSCVLAGFEDWAHATCGRLVLGFACFGP
jgi:hypothetical protein